MQMTNVSCDKEGWGGGGGSGLRKPAGLFTASASNKEQARYMNVSALTLCFLLS